MNIQVAGKHVEVGDSLREHIIKESDELIQKYFGDIASADVVISKEQHLFQIDLHFHITKDLIVHAVEKNQDPYHCFDAALAKVETRIRRYKQRLRTRKRHNHHDQEIISAQQYVLEGKEEDTKEEPVIIAEMSSKILTLSVGDAVMRMDLLEVPALMFKNVNNGGLNMVYRRADGNIGWIDPTF